MRERAGRTPGFVWKFKLRPGIHWRSPVDHKQLGRAMPWRIVPELDHSRVWLQPAFDGPDVLPGSRDVSEWDGAVARPVWQRSL
jgi:hypothetical protein